MLPLDYTNYEGQDAATFYAQDPQDFVGTFYLSVYEKKGACFDRNGLYELGSNILPSEEQLMSARARCGRLMAQQQIYSAGKVAMVEGKVKYNKDGFTGSRWVAFIPQPGKRYLPHPALGPEKFRPAIR